MENKPSVLYRGLKIDYNNLNNFEFSGVDLVVNYAPIIDKYGRKTVADGNEYGVYMSDNLNMVTSAYGNLHHDGILVSKDLEINHERIMIPSVAVIYEINPTGLNIRKPFISKELKEHYNNGFQGNEWIADTVPANNYKLYRVRIGKDILHDAEDIDLTKEKDIKISVQQELEMRKYRLELFANAIGKLPSVKRNLLGKDEISILRTFYGKNGLKYIDEDNLDTTSVQSMLSYLKAKIFRKNEIDIDFQTIKYINGLERASTSIDDIIEIIKSDKIKNMQEKIAFETRKKQEGAKYSTSRFDKKEKMLDSLLTMIFLRKKKSAKLNQSQSTKVFEDLDDDEEWEMIKEKYDYDELEPERQEVIRKHFQETIYKRKMKKNHSVDENLDDKEEKEIDLDDLEEERRII